MSEVKFRDDVIIRDDLDFEGLVDSGLVKNKDVLEKRGHRIDQCWYTQLHCREYVRRFIRMDTRRITLQKY